MDSDRQATRYTDAAAFGLFLGLGSLLVLVLGYYDDGGLAWWEGPALAASSFMGFRLAVRSLVRLLTPRREP
jgi:hypothetical protein